MNFKKYTILLLMTSQLAGCATLESSPQEEPFIVELDEKKADDKEHMKKVAKKAVIGTAAVVGVAAVILAGGICYVGSALAKGVASQAGGYGGH